MKRRWKRETNIKKKGGKVGAVEVRKETGSGLKGCLKDAGLHQPGVGSEKNVWVHEIT